MKNCHRYFISAFLLLFGAGAAFAQSGTLLDRLYEKFTASCVDLDYTYSSDVTGVKISGSGNIQVQGSMWHNEGNGLEIWCDGTTVWTADFHAEEVIIEPVTDDGGAELVNPALMFVRMKDFFEVSRIVDSADGKASVFVLKPIDEMDIDFFDVEVLKADASIRSGSFALSDGSSVRISVSSMKSTEKKPVAAFRPSQAFGSSWIVTDLR